MTLPYLTQTFHLSEMFQPDEKVLGTPTMPLLFSSLPWMVGNKELMMLLYTFLSWLILWMNWMNRMNES